LRLEARRAGGNGSSHRKLLFGPASTLEARDALPPLASGFSEGEA
jgi:hypothetical protein